MRATSVATLLEAVVVFSQQDQMEVSDDDDDYYADASESINIDDDDDDMFAGEAAGRRQAPLSTSRGKCESGQSMTLYSGLCFSVS